MLERFVINADGYDKGKMGDGTSCPILGRNRDNETEAH
jgi:hypothetical protein